MIPKIIHYCWFGGKEIPTNLRAYMETWSKYMPDWIYMKWSEDNFNIALAPLYVQQAYEARKFAFVSDYVRLWALEQYGGVYMDTDVEVIRPFDELPELRGKREEGRGDSFIGFEESKAKTMGTNVIGCEPHCEWVREMLEYYQTHAFVVSDSVRESERYDMTPNSELIARLMEKNGLVRNGKEQIIEVKSEDIRGKNERIHVYDYHYFSPITSTRVMRKTKDTYSIHHCYGSWTGGSTGNKIRNSVVVREIVNALIQIRRVLGKVLVLGKGSVLWKGQTNSLTLSLTLK